VENLSFRNNIINSYNIKDMAKYQVKIKKRLIGSQLHNLSVAHFI